MHTQDTLNNLIDTGTGNTEKPQKPLMQTKLSLNN